MLQKQQTVDDSQKTQQVYHTGLQKGKQLGLEETAHVETMCRSEHTSHCRVGYGRCNTVCNRAKTKCAPNCVSKPYDPQAACDKSAQKSYEERQDQGKGEDTSTFKSKWKANRSWFRWGKGVPKEKKVRRRRLKNELVHFLTSLLWTTQWWWWWWTAQFSVRPQTRGTFFSFVSFVDIFLDS